MSEPQSAAPSPSATEAPPVSARPPSRPSRFGVILLTLLGSLAVAALAAAAFYGQSKVGEGFELTQWQRFLGRFHPVVLHLPIGMLVLVFALEFGNLFRREKRDTTTVALFFTALASLIAAAFGLLLYLSNPLDYAEDMISSHLWWGVGFAGLVTAAWLLKLWTRVWGGRGTALYLPLLVVAGASMGLASHGGGSITHGKTYLTDEAPDSVRRVYNRIVPESKRLAMRQVEEAPKPVAQREVYADLVQPIFDQKCVSCHGPDKQKGKLRMDTYEALMAGGREGEAIEPGDAQASNIIFRIDLPLDDEEHMPPEGKRQMASHEIEIVSWWIDTGALPNQQISEVEVPPTIQEAIAKVSPTEVVEVSAGTAAVEDRGPAREELEPVVATLRDDFGTSLQFESQGSAALMFSAINLGESFTDEHLAKLKPVMPSLVSLDLSGTRVTDDGLEALSTAQRLRQLRLSRTPIQGSGLDHLSGLPQLSSVNLYGTAVTVGHLDFLRDLPALETVYLWQTGVVATDLTELREALPHVEWVMGIGAE